MLHNFVPLIKIRKSSGPRIESCGTPAKIEAQFDIFSIHNNSLSTPR